MPTDDMESALERNVDVELRTVGKNALIYSVGNIFVKSVTFLFIPLYTHYLSVYEVGVIVLLELLEVIYNAVSPLGIFGAMWRYFNPERTHGNLRRFISSNFLFLLFANIFLFLILLLIAPFLAEFYLSDANLTALSRLFILVLFLGIGRAFILNLLRIHEKALQFIILVLAEFILLVLLTCWFVIGLELGLWGVVYAKLITSSLVFVFAASSVVGRFGLEFDWEGVKRSLRYGLPLVFHGLSIYVLSLSDRFFIKELISVEAAGIYGISYKFGMILNMVLVTPFIQAWNPILFRLEKDRSQKLTYQKVALHYVQIATAVWLLISILSKYFVKVATTEEYFSAIAIIPWVAFSYLLYGLQNVFKAGALIHNQTLKMTTLSVLAAVINIMLNIVMIPLFGMMGAALATVFSYFAMTVLVLRLSQKYLPINWLWRKMMTIVLLGVAFAVAGAVTFGDLHLGLAKDLSLLLLFPAAIILFKLASVQEVRRFILRLKSAT